MTGSYYLYLVYKYEYLYLFIIHCLMFDFCNSVVPMLLLIVSMTVYHFWSSPHRWSIVCNQLCDHSINFHIYVVTSTEIQFNLIGSDVRFGLDRFRCLGWTWSYPSHRITVTHELTTGSYLYFLGGDTSSYSSRYFNNFSQHLFDFCAGLQIEKFH